MTEDAKNHPRDYRPLVLLIIGALAGAVVAVVGALNENHAITVAGIALCAGAIGVAVKLPSPGSSD